MGKKAVLILVAVFCFAGFSYANEEDCKALFDLYGKCYEQGKELKSLDKCKSLGEELYKELSKDAKGSMSDAASDLVSTVCDDACREAVDGTEKSDYAEFKEDVCK